MTMLYLNYSRSKKIIIETGSGLRSCYFICWMELVVHKRADFPCSYQHSAMKMSRSVYGFFIQVLDAVRRYFQASCKTLFYKGSCCITGKFCILLNESPGLRPLAAWSGWHQSAASSLPPEEPDCGTSLINCKPLYELQAGWHLLLLTNCLRRKNQSRSCLP